MHELIPPRKVHKHNFSKEYEVCHGIYFSFYPPPPSLLLFSVSLYLSLSFSLSVLLAFSIAHFLCHLLTFISTSVFDDEAKSALNRVSGEPPPPLREILDGK